MQARSAAGNLPGAGIGEALHAADALLGQLRAASDGRALKASAPGGTDATTHVLLAGDPAQRAQVGGGRTSESFYIEG